jgi:hypothetical protein
MLRRHSLTLLLSLFALFPRAAGAQPTGEAPRISIGGGAGLAFLYHGDFDFTPWAWDADLRIRMSRRVMLEVAAGEWRHEETNVYQDLPYGTGPGRIGQLEQTIRRQMQMAQANLLFRGGTTRVAAVVGGGVGILNHKRQTRSLSTGCSSGAVCGDFGSEFSRGIGTGQAVGGIEARIAGGLFGHGTARFIVPFEDPGGMELRLTAGVRWGF